MPAAVATLEAAVAAEEAAGTGNAAKKGGNEISYSLSDQFFVAVVTGLRGIVCDH